MLCCTVFTFVTGIALAQPYSSIDLDKQKPKKYENRKLASEKTDEQKYTFTRKLFQNTFSHFNYYFNANNNLNEIILNAKAAFKDDFTQPVIPFYNYSLDVTAQDKRNFDSVMYHCTAGILLHDLRTNWVDNLYMLIGKAYFLGKRFDSAMATFSYVNYAFAPKDDGYDIPIGSNESKTNGEFSVATKEKKNFVAHKPSRNDALLWMTRTLIDSGETSGAGGLIQILRNDPNFPSRLKTSLNEVIAYWFYTDKRYDSAAIYLTRALDNASGKLERARWQFLAGQLYERAANNEEAIKWYGKSASLTPDPIMEVYATLNSVKLNKAEGADVVQAKINSLVKLAKKEKYYFYRDIIYYVAAQAELERANKKGAMQFLQKSVKYAEPSSQQKSLSFLLAADISYGSKQFDLANALYDSIDVNNLIKPEDKDRVEARKSALRIINDNDHIVRREDSLQNVARMPAAERDQLINKIVKQQRKALGLKEQSSGGENSNPAVQQNANAGTLFNADSKSEWYFNNTSLRSNGFTEFRQKWGDRPNVDNWRRAADLNKVSSLRKETAISDSASLAGATGDSAKTEEASYESLLNSLPLTPDKLQKSNDAIAKALFTMGKTFQDKLEEYPDAIHNYETLNHRFAAYPNKEETLYNLYYCYNKIGQKYSADSSRQALEREYKDSKFVQSLNKPAVVVSETSTKNPATKKYDEIYNLFIEGNFEKAEAEKRAADSVYGKTYWSPQLLYIEAVYHVSRREDSAAILKLNDLVNNYGSSPLADKAKTMVDVLGRRSQIEEYLTKLEVKRNEDEGSQVVNLEESKVVNKVVIPKADSIVTKPAEKPVAIKMDTVKTAPPVTAEKHFSFNVNDKQYVLLLFDKVAPVFVNEAKNAFTRFNREKYSSEKLEITSVKLDDRFNLMLVGPFSDAAVALDYIDKTKPFTQGRILPWLTPDKYSYMMISQSNLDLLNENKDIDGYRKVLQAAIPNKF